MAKGKNLPAFEGEKSTWYYFKKTSLWSRALLVFWVALFLWDGFLAVKDHDAIMLLAMAVAGAWLLILSNDFKRDIAQLRWVHHAQLLAAKQNKSVFDGIEIKEGDPAWKIFEEAEKHGAAYGTYDPRTGKFTSLKDKDGKDVKIDDKL